MSDGINLLHLTDDRGKALKIVKTGRLVVVIMGLLTLVSLVVVFIFKNDMRTQVDEAKEYQAQLTTDINRLQDRETKILVFNQKYNDIKSFIDNEPDFAGYYEVMSKHFPESSSSGQLTSLDISGGGTVRAQLQFPNLIAFTSYLSKLESDSFKEDFSTVTITGISFNDVENKNFPFGLDVTF